MYSGTPWSLSITGYGPGDPHHHQGVPDIFDPTEPHQHHINLGPLNQCPGWLRIAGGVPGLSEHILHVIPGYAKVIVMLMASDGELD